MRERAAAARDGSKLLGSTAALDAGEARTIADHQLPYWTERMTVSYLRMASDHGGEAVADDVGYQLRWPDGETQRRAVFTRAEADHPGTALLSLEHPRVRGLTARLPHFVQGQPLTVVALEGISDKVKGTWSLWRVALRTKEGRTHRVMPLFISDEGRPLAPTARAVWDRLLDLDAGGEEVAAAVIQGEDAVMAYDRSLAEAEAQGKALFSELMDEHQKRQARQRTKGRRAFEARRKAIERVGLPQVRDHRLRELETGRSGVDRAPAGGRCGTARADRPCSWSGSHPSAGPNDHEFLNASKNDRLASAHPASLHARDRCSHATDYRGGSRLPAD